MMLIRLLVFATMMSLLSAAHSCSCISRSPQEQFNAAEYVFVGRIISSEKAESLDALDGRDGVIAKLQLQEIIKAKTPPPRVVTGTGSGDCGVPIFPALHYVFFANPDGVVSICTGTRPFLPSHVRMEFVRSTGMSSPRTLSNSSGLEWVLDDDQLFQLKDLHLGKGSR